MPVDDSAVPASPSPGALLRTARERAGLSVDDVSGVTRIRATLIRDLEADRLASSGGAVYARGHLKAIAAAVHADAAAVLAALDAHTQPADEEPAPGRRARPAPLAPVSTGSLAMPTPARPERRGPNWLVAAAAACAILVGLVAVGSRPGPSSPAPAQALLPPAVGTTAAATPPAAAPTPVPLQSGATAEVPRTTGAALRVRILAGASWVSVQNGTATLFEGVLSQGTVKDFADPTSLRLIVGNAGAVNVVCSGNDLDPAGGAGKVLRFTCGPAGLTGA